MSLLARIPLLRNIVPPREHTHRYHDEQDRRAVIRARLLAIATVAAGIAYLIWLFFSLNPHHPWMGGAFLFAEVERVESSSFYGAALPFLLLHAPAAGRSVRASALSTAALQTVLTEPKRYFDANWVWFGLAAADGLIKTATPAVDAISNVY